MNLQRLIEQYLTFRQSLGERYLTGARVLRAFGRDIGAAADVADVHAGQVDAFLAGSGPITSAWQSRHNILVGFYRYAVSRGHVAAAPLPAVVPKPPPPFVPYVYSHDELRRLVRGTGSYQRQRSILEPVTMRILVLLLYGAGLRVGEAIALDRADVDLDESLLTIRRTKFFKTRLVPVGTDLGRALAQYDARPQTPRSARGEGAPFLTTRPGGRTHRNTLEASFRRICEQADIRRRDGARYQPRLHDLRHSFAVHRLTTWYRQGADVQKLLPQLSVYLGHASIAATQVYLRMTPELLQEAGTRFARYAGQEVDHD